MYTIVGKFQNSSCLLWVVAMETNLHCFLPARLVSRASPTCTHARMASGQGNPRAEKYVWALSTGFRATEICAEFSCRQLTRAWNLLERQFPPFLRIDTPTRAHLVLHWRTNHHGDRLDDIFAQAAYNSSKRRGRQ